MVSKSKAANIATIIQIVGIFVSLSALLFGNNIVDRITGPRIVMDSTKIALNYPLDMNLALTEFATKNNIPFPPDCYRVITIKNNGFIASKNVNVQIKVGGQIFDLSFISTETITERKQISSDTYNFQMPRLSRNAIVEVVVWMKDYNQPLNVIYTDDYKSKDLIQRNPSSQDFPIIKILFLSILLVCLFFLAKNIVDKAIKNIEAKRVQQDYNLLMNLSNLFDEKDQEEENQEEAILQQDKVSANGEETKEKLMNFIRKVREM